MATLARNSASVGRPGRPYVGWYGCSRAAHAMAYHWTGDLNDGPTTAADAREVPAVPPWCASGRRVGYGCLRLETIDGASWFV